MHQNHAAYVAQDSVTHCGILLSKVSVTEVINGIKKRTSTWFLFVFIKYVCVFSLHCGIDEDGVKATYKTKKADREGQPFLYCLS